MLGKKHANTLGLFPEGAFQEHARKKWIITVSENDKLLGYLLFRVSASKSRVNITHLCVQKEARNKGIATILLTELVNKFKFLFRGIGLSCRNDYQEASELWKKFGFKPINERRSRSMEENYLTYWWFDFGNHDLFTSSDSESKVKAVIDANIIVHLREESAAQNKEAQILLSDWLLEEVDYYFASEIYNEIQRDKDQIRREKTRKFLSRFNELRIQKDAVDKIFNSLISIMPGTSDNDISDKRQLSETIASGLEYFITGDKEILNNADILLKEFGLGVVRPSEFVVELDEVINKSAYQPIRLGGVDFDFCKMSSNDISDIIDKFHNAGFNELKNNFDLLVTGLTSDVNKSEIKILKDKSKEIIAIIGERSLSDSTLEIPLLRIKKSPLCNTLFKQLIFDKIIHSINKDYKILKVSEKFLNADYEEILHSFNFVKINDDWNKISIKGIVKSDSLISNLANLIQDEKYSKVLDLLTETKGNVHLWDNKLIAERFFFPVKIQDLNIPTFIIPIKPIWAGHLFDSVTASETILGAKPELAWNRENIYYRSKNPNVISFPARILWYLSDQNGYSRSKMLVACSYLDEVEIDTVKSLFRKHKRFGIYEWEDVLKVGKNNHENEIMAIRFSDTELFKRAITYKKLNKLLLDKTDKYHTFQSPVEISNEVFQELYRNGMNLK
jgi:GNAT superfamily N-acetyltransferase